MKIVPIHTWGGLGSQLFALALHFDLEREIKLKTYIVLHSSGVTKRRPELEDHWPQIQVLKVDDFEDSRVTATSQLSVPNLNPLRRVSRSLINISGLIATCNTDKEFRRVRPFVKQFRGHYSNRHITPWTINAISNSAKSTTGTLVSINDEVSGELSIHYRLGDLLTLPIKKPLDSKRVSNLIQKIFRENNLSHLLISSDSPEFAIQNLQVSSFIKCHLVHGDSFKTIQQLQNSYIFVGTNSKISLWIALIRIYFKKYKDSWMPKEMMGHLVDNIDNSLLRRYIHFY